MKVIYMNDTLCLLQSNAKNLYEFDDWVLYGELKTLNEIPYLVIINNEE